MRFRTVFSVLVIAIIAALYFASRECGLPGGDEKSSSTDPAAARAQEAPAPAGADDNSSLKNLKVN